VWHVSSRSGEASRELLYSVYFTYFTLLFNYSISPFTPCRRLYNRLYMSQPGNGSRSNYAGSYILDVPRREKQKNGYIKVSDKVSGKVLLHAYLEITEFHFNTGAENRQKNVCAKSRRFARTPAYAYRRHTDTGPLLHVPC